MDDWTTAIDVYCERTDATFWSEPINAVTNIAFVLAGFALLWRVRGVFERILCANLILIGIGSFLFHTVAQRWSAMADVLPIFTFIAIATYGLFYRFLQWPVWGCALGTLITLATTIAGTQYAFDRLDVSMNGSENYGFALIILLVSGFVIKRFYPYSATLLLASGSVFIVSLMMRSMDMSVCPTLHMGTHFLWHILNAVTLSLIILAFDRRERLTI